MNKDTNKAIIKANIRKILQGMFSSRCQTLVIVGLFDRYLVRTNNIDNSLLSAKMIDKETLFALDDYCLSKMFKVVIKNSIVGLNLTQYGHIIMNEKGNTIKPMHFNSTHFTEKDIDNYYYSLDNVKQNANYGEKVEYFVGNKINDIEKDKRWKQDILYRGKVNGKEVKRICQCKYMKQGSTANIDIDFVGIFGIMKKEFLETY